MNEFTTQARSKVAIVMATHNDPETLDDAIESIVMGSYPTDLYVVDDASEPPIQSWLRPWPNVKVIRLSDNVGLTRALNIGLRAVLKREEYPYIGRMDADDISARERIAAQVSYLETHPDVSGVGCWANYVDRSSGCTVFKCMTPVAPADVARALPVNNCVLHPTWLMRANIYSALEGYNEDYPVAQDYEFLMRGLARGHRFANVPAFLLDYRISSDGISVKKRKLQLYSRLRVQLTYFDWISMPAWVGMLKTLLLFCIPRAFVTWIKSCLRRSDK